MNLTKQQRNVLICAAVIFAAYIFHSIVGSYFEMRDRQRIYAMRVAQQKARTERARAEKAKQAANHPAPAPPAPQRVVPQTPVDKPSPFDGLWFGQVPIANQGSCQLKVEIKDKDGKSFTGFSTLQCSPDFLNTSNAVLSGEMKDGTIEFHVDKTIGTDNQGCSITSLKMTPFGTSQFAAEWTQGKGCRGGHSILSKNGRLRIS